MEPFTPQEKARLLQYGTQEELAEYVGLLAGRFDKDPSKELSPEERAADALREQRLDELVRKFYPKDN